MPIKYNLDQGFSLIEILISIVILSIALLGLAQTQTKALKVNNSALLRAEAVEYAYDMADRIHSNAMGKAAYNLTLGNSPSTSVKRCSTEITNDIGVTCTVQEMAAFDLAQWYCSVKGDSQSSACSNIMSLINRVDIAVAHGLPDPRLKIAWNSASEDYTITIEWLEDNTTNTYGRVYLEVSPWEI